MRKIRNDLESLDKDLARKRGTARNLWPRRKIRGVRKGNSPRRQKCARIATDPRAQAKAKAEVEVQAGMSKAQIISSSPNHSWLWKPWLWLMMSTRKTIKTRTSEFTDFVQSMDSERHRRLLCTSSLPLFRTPIKASELPLPQTMQWRSLISVLQSSSMSRTNLLIRRWRTLQQSCPRKSGTRFLSPQWQRQLMSHWTSRSWTKRNRTSYQKFWWESSSR